MGVFKKLLVWKPNKIEKNSEKKEECWYNNAHEQGQNHDALPMDAAGSVNLFERNETKSNASH